MKIVTASLAVPMIAGPLLNVTRTALLCILKSIQASEYNATRISAMGLLPAMIDRLIKPDIDASLLSIITALVQETMRFGLTRQSDAIELVRAAQKSPKAMRLLLDLTKQSNQALQLHFDLALFGHASIEFASLPEGFPSQHPKTGYTFMAYVRVHKFDELAHTTLFGVLDPTQACFLLIELEKETHQLVLQTSVTSSKPSVRFRSFSFSSGVWYHIALVHRRARVEGPSRAALFVNGDFCEQIKCPYPMGAPSRYNAPEKTTPSSIVSLQQGEVQAFFGTPRDLSPHLGSNKVVSSWSLATAQLISEVLPDELIYVYKSLGPSYCGNFQDCLGSFQTYRASAALNLRNELLHPATQNHSLISSAIRFKAGLLNDERNFLLSISAASVTQENEDPASQFSTLSLSVRLNVGYAIRNHASLAVTKAPGQKYDRGFMTQGVTACIPKRLDDVIASISGPVGPSLWLLYTAHSRSSFEMALQLVFELITGNWRNSESFERENGFAILAWILRQNLSTVDEYQVADGQSDLSQVQLSSLSYQTLRDVLSFVGYKENRLEESIIINPLAYRALIVDADVWRSADVLTQIMFYKQFVVFGSQSEHSSFNIKRLNRMRTYMP